MSFFGFDPTQQPPGSLQDDKVYDFEETYDGLGELEEEDAFNDETFGTSTKDIRKDFEFGSTTTNENDNKPKYQPASAPALAQSYAQAAQSNPVNDDEFMEELWGSSNAPSKSIHEKQKQSNQQVSTEQQQERKILSLEEIEAQLMAIDNSQQPHPQQFPQPGSFPPQPFGLPGMMPQPPFNGYMMGNYMQPQYGFAPPPQQFPPMQGLPPQLQQQFQKPSPTTQQQPTQQHQPQQEAQQFSKQSQQQQQQHQAQQQQPVSAPQDQSITDGKKALSTHHQKPQKVDLSQFPVLGKGALQQPHHVHQQQAQLQSQQQQKHQQQHPQENNQQQQHHHNRQQSQDLTPEQQEKAARRQEKVSRIMKYSGIMNPKDKDFVTRFQLSQIVTEDPYNEDFYAQVYKVIHPKTINGIQQQIIPSQQSNSIAQAYLDHSGHRLGGRYKRADVALQRMQQQVQKAVHVAKERPKLTQYAKEGALGKISFGSGKKPRQQLEIISKAAEREKNDNNNKNDLKKQDIKKYNKKDISRILENIIIELMNVESESRTSNSIDTTRLWESMKVLDQSSISGDEESEVNPFIQCLNYNKMLKILIRLFKFLTREQILTISALIMSNLENLLVIKNGSYTTYENKQINNQINQLVESYSLTFSKLFMNSVVDFKFNEIIGLLVILIEHNNVSFISTTKIGLTILTTLLSRAELIIGEGSISATDLSEWTSTYDELFTSLESRISAIFPPNSNEINDGSIKENYIWQFLATLSLGGKLNHQRIIVDEVRDEIFGVMNKIKLINENLNNNGNNQQENSQLLFKKQNLLNNLNMFLVVMGLVADENEIKEL
ncbi:PAT1 [Candida pseudojiufengensis]|uniref:PAT1 n=1 Tax=Candida pseudojiufengensis TaxID=497109 RepID=UPI0022244062|nr:PAT1 [Candida pseudojiufengensis]KAI5965546.1 PAT1 [Candida pseudojiufengensis]